MDIVVRYRPDNAHTMCPESSVRRNPQPAEERPSKRLLRLYPQTQRCARERREAQGECCGAPDPAHLAHTRLPLGKPRIPEGRASLISARSQAEQAILSHSILDMVRHHLAIVQADLDAQHRNASPVKNWRL